MKKIIISFLLSIFGILSFGANVSAQINSNLLDKMTGNTQILNKSVNPQAGNLTGSEMDSYIGGIIGLILSFAGVIFLVLIIIAGYLWITAQGVEEKITKAKQLLTNGIIGALVSFGAFILINTVISPLYDRFYSPAQISSAGNGGEQTIIPCEVTTQCADQQTRKLCINGNCSECEINENNSESEICKGLYGQNKPSCDTQNHVCVPNPTMGCSPLDKNTCLSQGSCRWNYGNSFYSGNCVSRENYGCSSQCQGNKPLCLLESNPPSCVECRDDNDCADNWLDKKCSVSTGNYICVPF